MRTIIVDAGAYETTVILTDTEKPEEVGVRSYRGEGLNASEITQNVIDLAKLGNADLIRVETMGIGRTIYDNLKHLERNNEQFSAKVTEFHILNARAVVNSWSRADRKLQEPKEPIVPVEELFVKVGNTDE
ncbi:hypothetical protein F400_gp010 [Bacillus phage BCD7]|uniref:Uncharacterized protein n=1 Tax=Bacillus phage BCD7 TaxID=1136534 RepID=J9PUC2_9CAUD|nr:hypothetical protein F400_gp010 [Bacillus phage BCD7]AEZ50457.1 hypothetical protein BCD7_0010 [Bacillus phage BCD7]